MQGLNLDLSQIPFLLGGTGTLHIAADVPDLTQKIPESGADLFTLAFNASAGQTFTVGAADSIKLGIAAGASVRLVPIWSSSSAEVTKLLEPYELQDYFDPARNHGDKMLFLFLCGANFDASVDAKFSFTTLSTGTSFKAGADASYALLATCDKTKAAAAALTDFFGELKLPGNIAGPMQPDEMIAFGYGGYLKLGASVGIGYEISGGHSFDLGTLALTEKYDFSLGGKLTLGADIAGQFSVRVHAGENGWARVAVHKGRQSNFTIAADVNAGAQFSETGLPDSSQDFISAILGIKAKNWINLFDQATRWTDFSMFEQNLDGLARTYIEEYIGKGFDQLANNAELNALMTRLQKVVASYNDAGNDAVTLFDHYFDAGQNALDQELTDALTAIKSATSWDALKSRLNGAAGRGLWIVVNQLTAGDPLGWILGKIQINGQPASLDLLKTAVDKVFSLVQDSAHAEIRKVIALAKSQFPLDRFLTQLNGIDWLKLNTLADAKAVGFAERLIGQHIQGLSNSDLKAAAARLNSVLNNIEKFTDTAYGKFQDALNQRYRFQFHAGYSRATVDDALIDIELNLNTPDGRRLMKAAGLGDFSEVLKTIDPSFIRINSGVLTDSVTRQSTLAVNITGWHLNWKYESLDQLIIQAEQRISSDANGSLTIDTTFSLNDNHEQKRNGERLYMNLLLGFIGQSKGKVEFDKRTQRYLIQAITGITARYDLNFDDPDTAPVELAAYLSFADDFGLAASDTAAEHELAPILATDARGNYGHVTINYDVRFTEDGLKNLFTRAFTITDEAFLRRTMRFIVLVNSLKVQGWTADMAWCYWSNAAYQQWLVLNSSISNIARAFKIDASPLNSVTAPGEITLPTTQLFVLHTLFSIEQSLVVGMAALSNIVRSSGAFTPKQFEDKLTDFGKALQDYDGFSQGDNAIFALFDQMIQRAGGGRNSSLTLTADVNGNKTTKMLIA